MFSNSEECTENISNNIIEEKPKEVVQVEENLKSELSQDGISEKTIERNISEYGNCYW